MSDPSTRLDNDGNNSQKRSLPSWMNSSSDDEGKSHGKKSSGGGETEESKKTLNSRQAKGSDKADKGTNPSKGIEESKTSEASSSSTTNFSKLLEGVVFVLSGFVNPERSTLRSQAIAMGADYRADWNSDCTLLVCAFPNTPKFRQVKADCGTIISKDWITECYNQKKLVEIERYLMSAGKSWRKISISHTTSQEESLPRKSHKVESGSLSKSTSSTSSKNKASNPAKDKFSPSELKKWAADDLNKTIAWLESQEEKPEENEIKQIAAEGILTCLQDAIDSLEQKQGVQQIVEQWQCLPLVVEELAKLDEAGKGSTSYSQEDLCKQVKEWKRIYEDELRRLESESSMKKKRSKSGDKVGKGKNKETSNAAGSDSDETIEMTEEEIELAYKSVNS